MPLYVLLELIYSEFEKYLYYPKMKNRENHISLHCKESENVTRHRPNLLKECLSFPPLFKWNPDIAGH